MSRTKRELKTDYSYHVTMQGNGIKHLKLTHIDHDATKNLVKVQPTKQICRRQLPILHHLQCW